MMAKASDQREDSPGQLKLLPGFRFHPTDEELVVHYLLKKAAAHSFAIPIIAELDLYKFDPWDLPDHAIFGEREWYFFSPRDRKYPNGARPNRAAASGYWKATGTDKPIFSSVGSLHIVGVKKVLVFYKGKAPKGIKTNWIMHEYRLTDSKGKPSYARQKGSIRLDDWVLCRIYNRNVGSGAEPIKALTQSPSENLVDQYSHTILHDDDDAANTSLDDVLTLLPDIDESKLLLPRLSFLRAFTKEEDPSPKLMQSELAVDYQISKRKLQNCAKTESDQWQQHVELPYFNHDSRHDMRTKSQQDLKLSARSLEEIDTRSVKPRLNSNASATNHEHLQSIFGCPIIQLHTQSQLPYSLSEPLLLRDYTSLETNALPADNTFFGQTNEFSSFHFS